MGRKVTTFTDVLLSRADTHEDRRAYIFLRDGEDEEATLTFGQLHRRALAVAERLKELGEPGDRALLLYAPGLEFIVSFFGCLYAGVIPVPASIASRKRGLEVVRGIAIDSGARLILSSGAVLAKFEDVLAADPGLQILKRFNSEEWRNEASASSLPVRSTPSDTALLQYTSGSTGTPRGVVVTHANLVDNHRQHEACFASDSNTIAVSWLPMFHDMGLGTVMGALWLGVPCVLMAPTAFLQKPVRWLRAISNYRATSSGGPDFAYDLCVRRIDQEDCSGLDLSSWRVAYNGSEPVRPATLWRFAEAFAPFRFQQKAFHPVYGLAEATLFVSGEDVREEPIVRNFSREALERGEGNPDTSGKGQALVSCGAAWLGGRIEVVNPETRRLSAAGQIGEVWVAGPSVAAGYWQRPKETVEAFQARTADGEGPFLRTGDLGFLHEGRLFVTGRSKDLIIVRGRNHYPQDIEVSVSDSHPAIEPLACAAFSVESDDGERLVIAQEVKRTAVHRLQPEAVFLAIRSVVSARHGLHAHAISLLSPGALPRTTSGKVRRKACKQAFLSQLLPALAVSGAESVGAHVEEAGASPPSSEQPRAPERERPSASATSRTTAANSAPASSRAGRAWIITWLARRLGVAESQIDPHRSFADHGLDSLAAAELAKALSDRLGRGLDETLLWSFTTIDALVEHLEGTGAGPQTGRSAGSGTTPSSVVSDDQASLEDEIARPGTAPMNGVAERRLGLLNARRQPEPERQWRTDPIAIVGIGCRFPGGASSPAAFWRVLRDGVDATVDVPSDRWDAELLYDQEPDTPGKIYVKRGGFLERIDGFEPEFFGISPREAVGMDPQQRLLLEVAWEALEDAGIPPAQLKGSATGVWLGLCLDDYARRSVASGDLTRIDPYNALGNTRSVAAGRISYVLDLRGPAVQLDTSCSSSLVAVHQACQSLRAGESDLALVGGVNLMSSPEATVALCRLHALSPDGRCKTFDASADGYGRGEGCGIVVLKRLADATACNDHIYAVLRGTAINHDGRSNGLTAPNGLAQEALIRSALANAGLEPSAIDYVEAHGTGTLLGDPIEVLALSKVYGEGRPIDAPVYLGAVKANLGHLEAAAGVASLIKVALCMDRGTMVPHINLHRPNPRIPWERLAVRIATEMKSWPRNGKPRRAGVSAFGMSGTNAHALLEEAPALDPAPSAPVRSAELVVLSAKTTEALDAAAARLREHVEAHPEIGLGDLAYSLITTRSMMEHRWVMSVPTRQALIDALYRAERGETPFGGVRGKAREQRGKLGWLFTGQGAQKRCMGRGLYAEWSTFRDALDNAFSVIDPLLDRPLRQVMWAERGSSDAALLNQTGYTQPALFAFEWALAQLWRSWGVEPDLVLGHSVGEITAACVASVFSLPDAARLVCARARLMQALPTGGAMVAIAAPQPDVAAAVAHYAATVSIAAINGPASTVIAGVEADVLAVSGRFAARGVQTWRLTVSHAFHSPLMDPMLATFRDVAESIDYRAPRLPLVSNLSGELAGDDVATPDYWVRHARETVRFSQGVEALQAADAKFLLEIGPKATLLGLASASVSGHDVVMQPSLRAGRSETEAVLEALGRVIAQGGDVKAHGLYPTGGRRVELPTYPWQRQRHWALAREATGNEVIADVTPADSTGGVVAELAALRLRRADHAVPGGLGMDAAQNAFYRLDWQSSRAPAVPTLSGRWLILSVADHPQARALAATLRAHGANCEEALLAELQHAQPAEQVVCFWDSEGEAAATIRAAQQGLAVAQTLATRRPPPRLWWVTQGAMAITAGRDVSLPSSSLWGLGRTLMHEHPELGCTLIDLEPHVPGAEVLLRELGATDDETQVAWRSGERHVARLVRAPLTSSVALAENYQSLPTEASVLITGGLGALGLEVARHFARRGVQHLLLIGRRGLRTPHAAQAVAELEALGARVTVAAVDVAEREALAQVLANVPTDYPLRGIVHTAGLVDDGLLMEQTPKRLSNVMAPKVAGAWNLHELTRHTRLDFFVLFSSIAGTFGSPAQGGYAAANAFLDALAVHRRALGLPASSLAWGPWAERGMAAALDAKLRARFARQGISMLSLSQGLPLLDSAMHRNEPQLVVVPLDVGVAATALGPSIPPFWRSLLRSTSTADAPARGSWAREVLALPPDAQLIAVAEVVRAEIARVLSLQTAAQVPPDRPLQELGLDSLMAIELRNTLGRRAGVTLSANLAFEHPTPRAMAQYLFAEVLHSAERPSVQATSAERSAPGEVASNELQRLTPRGEYPATNAQERLWFSYQLAREDPVYNIAIQVRICGALQRGALQHSIERTLWRHEALRSRFRTDAQGRLFQWVDNASDIDVRWHDLSGAVEPEAAVLAWIEREERQPFDLEHGPLVRCTVIVTAKDEWVLSITSHHILVDGWSLQLLLSELTQTYAALVGDAGTGEPSPVLHHMGDHAAWEHQLVSEGRARPEPHWHEALADLPALSLPRCTDESSSQDDEGSIVHFELSAELSDLLRALSRRSGVTLNTTLSTAFGLLLSRYSGQLRFGLGMITANRTRREQQAIVGFLANTMLVICDFEDNPSLDVVLARMQKQVERVIETSWMPMSDILHTSGNADAGLGRSARLSAVVGYQSIFPSTSWKFDKATWSLFNRNNATGHIPGTSKFDLWLSMYPWSDGVLGGSFEFRTGVLSRSYALQFVRHFERLLESMTRGARQLSDLSIFGRDDEDAWERWNATAAEYPKNVSLHHLFAEQVRKRPAALAVSTATQQLTYAELNERANGILERLRSAGVRRAMTVAICLERSVDMVASLLAIVKAGATYVPLDPEFPAQRLRFMLEDSKAAIVVSQRHIDGTSWPATITRVDLDRPASTLGLVATSLHSRGAHDELGDDASRGGDGITSHAANEALTYIIYTSGSTGRPKGVCIRQSAVLNLLSSVAKLIEFNEHDALLAVTTLSFDIAALELFMPLIYGGRLELASAEEARDVQQLQRRIRDRNVTVMQATPATWQMFRAALAAGNQRLRVLCGGEALPADLANWLASSFGQAWNMYGPTETTIWSTAYRLPGDDVASVPIGWPLANTQTHVLDSTGRRAPIGVPGELYIAGHGLAAGYLGQIELTTSKFSARPWTNDNALMYRTGDRVRQRRDGVIEFLARLDDQVKIRGFRIELGEIEHALLSHAHILQCVCAPRSASGEAYLVAYLVAKRGVDQVSDTDLIFFLGQTLPSYMLPAAFVWLDSLPLTQNGKIDRKALPSPTVRGLKGDVDYVTSSTPLERVLCRIWEEVLELRRVGIDDDFFWLGGDSLKSVRVQAKAGKVGLTLTIRDLFEARTIRALARRIERDGFARDTLPAELMGPGSAKGTDAEQMAPDVDGVTLDAMAADSMSTLSTQRLMSDLPHVTMERLPATLRAAARDSASVDAAAVVYLPPMSERTLPDLKRWVFADGCPAPLGVHNTSLGRIALIAIPIASADVYTERAQLLTELVSALRLAQDMGARVVSLTGLIPSATGLGQDLESIRPPGTPELTTGHATTVSAVAFALERTLQQARLQLSNEVLAMVGLGSIGSAALNLVLSVLPLPRRVILCDLFSRRDHLLKLAADIKASHGVSVEVCAADVGRVPLEVYRARVIIGATNVPEVLDVAKLQPGSIIVDDSAPHCFNVAAAKARIRRHRDLIANEAGLLQTPEPLRHQLFLPKEVPDMPALFSEVVLQRVFAEQQIMGCVLSSALSGTAGLPRTLGLVKPADALAHYRALANLGYGPPASLQCHNALLDTDD